MPTADDLFRPTVVPDPDDLDEPEGRAVAPEEADDAAAATGPAASTKPAKPAAVPTNKPEQRAGSGRVKHDEKMTVYVTSDELLDLEHARLTLRRSHGLAVDRGRLVRAAVALALADLDEHGEDSVIVQRLRQG